MRYKKIKSLIIFCLVSLQTFFVNAYTSRLPDGIQLESQKVYLKLDIDNRKVLGETELNFIFSKPSDVISYHAHNLNIQTVKLYYRGGSTLLENGVPNQYEIIEHTLSEQLVDKATLVIHFESTINSTVEGLFISPQSKSNTVLSQFQAMGARKVFPSLDEPNKKTEFLFSVEAPRNLTVVHSTKVRTIDFKGENKVVHFYKTPRMNTDILALGVGKLESKSLSNHLQSRVYFEQDNSLKLPKYLSKTIDKTIEFIEEYLNSPFPYSHLDFLVGDFGGVAAMENLGLISLNNNQIPAPDASMESHCQFKKLIAHEIAHSWFGNSITMKWYDDYWLNESFTEFLAAKVIQAISTDNQRCTFTPQSDAFHDDNDTSMPLTFDVKDRKDTLAYGQLYYTKGRALLEMLDNFMGPNEFQAVLKEYVKRFDGGNVSTEEFINLFKDKEIQGVIASFTRLNGFPKIKLENSKSGWMLSQSNQGLLGHKKWHIPLTIKLWDGNTVKKKHMVLSDQKKEIQFPKNVKAIFLDGGGVGYFRYLDQSGLNKFPFQHLSEEEKVSYRQNQQALALSGDIDYMDYILSVTKGLNESFTDKLELTEYANSLIDSFIEIVPNNQRDRFKNELKKLITLNLSWNEQLNKANQNELLVLFGVYLEDDIAIEAAKNAFYSRVDYHSSNFDSILKIVSMHSSIKEYRQLIEQYDDYPLNKKHIAISALGYVDRKEKVDLYYSFLLSESTRGMVIDYRFQFPIFNSSLRVHAAKKIMDYQIDIFKRIPKDALQWFPYNFLVACTKEEQRALDKLFVKSWLSIPGLNKKLITVKELINDCGKRQRKVNDSIEAYFKSR